MTPEDAHRWKVVDELFRRALDRPASDRRAFVEAEAAGDPSIVVAVERLLESADRAAGFLETPVPRGCGLTWGDLFERPERTGRDPPR